MIIMRIIITMIKDNNDINSIAKCNGKIKVIPKDYLDHNKSNIHICSNVLLRPAIIINDNKFPIENIDYYEMESLWVYPS